MYANCLVCDCLVEKPSCLIENKYVICSEECKKEWDELTYSEKQRYLECMMYLHEILYN